MVWLVVGAGRAVRTDGGGVPLLVEEEEGDDDKAEVYLEASLLLLSQGNTWAGESRRGQYKQVMQGKVCSINEGDSNLIF